MCAIILSRMGKIARYLNELIIGNVFDTPEILESYAVDRSVVQIKPKAVALPESTEDLSKLMRFCTQLAIKDIKVPVSVWGSGLDEMGADVGEGIIISTEKLNRLMEADRRERLVRVQAGIYTQMLADWVFEVVLPSGDILQTNRQNTKGLARVMQDKTIEGRLYRKVTDLIKNNAELIQDIKKTGHGSAGYATIAQVERKGTVDLMPLFFGAQGTLGVISEVIIRAVPIRSKTARVMATFKDFVSAQKFLDFLNELKPCQLDVYDIEIIRAAKKYGKKLSAVSDRAEMGFVVFSKFDHKINSCLKKIKNIKIVLPRTAQLIMESPENQAKLDEFESSLTSFLNQVRTGERVPMVIDFYLPSENILKFLDDLSVVEKSLKMELRLFGSYAASNYNLRPKFNLEDEDFAKKALSFIRACNFIIERQGGSITGGSPEGRVKAIVTNTSMSEKEKALYGEIKKIFDPREILNADVKLGADAKYTVKHFRTSNSSKTVL